MACLGQRVGPTVSVSSAIVHGAKRSEPLLTSTATRRITNHSDAMQNRQACQCNGLAGEYDGPNPWLGVRA